MTKQQIAFRKFSGIGGILVLFVIGLYGLQHLNDVFYSWRDTSLSTWILAETQSPTRLGKADFLVDAGSFGGSSTYFFVIDTTKTKANPLRVGGPYASDGPIKMDEAVWSKDGSVIAVRVKLNQSAGSFWKDAYDFRKHQVVLDGAKIGALLAERGGISSTTLSAPSTIGKPVSNSEAHKYDTSYDSNKDF